MKNNFECVDVETGTMQESNTSGNAINLRCSKLVFKIIFGLMVVTVAIGYFTAISRNSNLIENFDEFDIAYVNDSLMIGKFSNLCQIDTNTFTAMITNIEIFRLYGQRTILTNNKYQKSNLLSR